MTPRAGVLLILAIVFAFAWFVVGVVIPDGIAAKKADRAERYTVTTLGTDGKEGQRWEYVQILWDDDRGGIRFTDQRGHDVRVTGPRIRIKE